MKKRRLHHARWLALSALTTCLWLGTPVGARPVAAQDSPFKTETVISTARNWLDSISSWTAIPKSPSNFAKTLRS